MGLAVRRKERGQELGRGLEVARGDRGEIGFHQALGQERLASGSNPSG